MADLVARFWDKYISKTISYKVSEGSRLWYVKHVEAFIKSRKGARLAMVSVADVEAYLEVIGRKRYMTDWKFRQVVDALRILFCDLINSPWARDFNWQMWVGNSKDQPEDHVTIAHTSSIASDNKAVHGSENMRVCRQEFSGLFGSLIKEIRLRGHGGYILYFTKIIFAKLCIFDDFTQQSV